MIRRAEGIGKNAHVGLYFSIMPKTIPAPPGAADLSAGRRPDPAGSRSLARSVLAGTGLIAAAGAAVKLIGLLSSPILTRLAGPSPYGVVALAGTISSLATTVALMGMDLSYARYFFEDAGRGREQVERFCWRFTLGTGAVMSILAGWAWRWMDDSSGSPWGVAAIVAASTFAAATIAMATTRQRVRGGYTRISAAVVSGSLVGVPLSLLLAWLWRADEYALLLGALAGSAVTAAVLGLPPADSLLSPSGLDGKQRRDLVRMGAAAAVTAPMFWVMNSADRWFLEAWAGEGAVGVYSFAAGIGMAGTMVIGALTTAWFPEMSREYEALRENALGNIGRLWARFAVMHMVTWLAVAAAGGDTIRLVADPRFHEGAVLVPWLAGGIFFYGMAALANTGLFLAKTQGPAAFWWVVGAACNVVCNALLVRRFGPTGASLSLVAGFAVIAAGTTWSAQSRLCLPIPWGRILAAGSITLAAGAFTHFPWSASPICSLLMKLPAGAGVAAVVSWIAAPDWARRLVDRARGRGMKPT